MKKKTTSIKNLTGTNRPDKAPQKLTSKLDKAPPPQKYLSTDARKIYRAICKHLLENNSLCEIDSYYVSMAALSFCDFAKFAKEASENGYIQTYESGATNISTEYVIMRNERQAIETFCKNLGLNAKAREALIAFSKEPEQNNDVFSQLLARKSNMKKVV